MCYERFVQMSSKCNDNGIELDPDAVAPESYIKTLLYELESKQKEIESLKNEVNRLQRQCDKTAAYNEDLRHQVTDANAELAKVSRGKVVQTKEISVQVSSTDLDAALADGDWTVASEKANVSVADCVRAAAEEVTATAGYIYDEKSGYYYDSSSGYYYDPEQSLYYDAKTGIYFFYNADSGKYEYHSQVDVLQSKNEQDATEEEAKPEKLKKSRKKKGHYDDEDGERNSNKTKKSRKKPANLLKHSRVKVVRVCHGDRASSKSKGDSRSDVSSAEEGECTSSPDSLSKESDNTESSNDIVEAPQYPPCIRVIVQETSIDQLPVGTLFLVTCSGAIVGREKTCDVRLQDIEVSKAHAQFVFLEVENVYKIKDLGSQNGTYLNDVRLSDPKLESGFEVINHGDIVRFGSTKLLLHIHKGLETCFDCEPGLVQAIAAAQNPNVKEVQILTKNEKEHQRRRALKQIKRRFGLEASAFESVNSPSNPDYQDRARERRKTKGSDNPYEKTEMASVESVISSKNKGFKMLEKMGWSSGQSLGKSQAGIVEPITVNASTSKSGLGFAGPSVNVPQDRKELSKHQKWTKAQQRYRNSETSSVVRLDEDGDTQNVDF